MGANRGRRYHRLALILAHLDSPAPGEKVYDQAIFISGWLYAPEQDPAKCRVRAYLEDICCAETRMLFSRADVSEKLALPREVPTGFRMLGQLQPAVTEPRAVTLRVVASWDEKSHTTIAEQPLSLVPASLGARAHGEVLRPDNATLLHRSDIYGSGPPIMEPSPEVINLLHAYLPPTTTVVDVGCGSGAYSAALTAAGHSWLGLESSAHCCEILRRRQLLFREVQSPSGALPCATAEWDCAICLEVLEHVNEPEFFVNEIARVVRRRALFSVPNMEVLPYFHGWGVVPWHLLEADHKNFFTRASLGRLLERSFRNVEVLSYCEHPLKTREEIALHLHLFAIADK